MKNRNLYRIAGEGFGVGACLLLISSCLSFSIADWPSGYVWPHNDPSANWCGPAGAFFAYYLLYYAGPGVLLLLGAGAWSMCVGLAGRKISQPIMRIAGSALLVIALSCTVHLLLPHSENSFQRGNGGILGISVAAFLKRHFATLGTVILVSSVWVVGAILLADTAVLWAVRWFGLLVSKLLGFAVPAFSAARSRTRAMNDIWKKLSSRQRKERKRPLAIMHEHDVALEVVTGRRTYDDVEDDEEEEEQEEVEVVKAGRAKRAVVKKAVPKAKEKDTYVPKSYEDYELPPLDLLEKPEYAFASVQSKMVEQKAAALENLLAEFGVNAEVVNAEPGPAITMYELELAPGIKVSQITNLANDMARALSAGSVRVVAPLAGRHTIGVEAPNSQRETVRIKELIERSGSKPKRMQIPLFLGKSSSGEVLVSDLSEMPHLLIAGTTGSGKSVCINTIITSILLTKRPDEVKLILIDPKMVEMAAFDMIPHLMCPTVTETKRAEQILEWATTKMDERYELLSEARVRNIGSYNKLGAEEVIKRFKPTTPEEEAKIPKKLPHIVIVIDELADLMMTAAKEIESYIVRLAQKSRAVGIHLVVATQRPQATVVTGLIKSNMPARIGFRVAARMDSRIILDQNGAETLLGEGDMLFLKPGTSDLVRAQGAYLDDGEIRAVVKHLKEVAEPQFHPELMQLNRIDVSMLARDDLFDEAVRVVLESGRGSVSLLQRRLSVGYARASRMIEVMAASGILGEYKGSQAREVMMTVEDYDQLRRDMLADEVAGYADLTEEEPEEEAVAVATLEAEEELEEEGDDEEDEYEDEDEEGDDDEYEEEEEEE